MKTINSPVYSRNYGFWSEAEQQELINAKIAIAGVGGDGFQLGLKLARMGVQNFSIADPEVFEYENINRVPGALNSTIGKNKAEVYRDMVYDINPLANVRIYTQGVQENNVEDFMAGATLVIDESELTHLEIGTLIARQARIQNIPNISVMNIGFASQLTAFHPTEGITFEKLMGIPEEMPLSEVKNQVLKLDRCLPYLPIYGDINSLIAVKGGSPLPSISIGVDCASALASTQVFLHIVQGLKTQRPKPIWAPSFVYIDAYSCKSGRIRFPKISYRLRLVNIVVRNIIGRNPKCEYEEQSRQRRLFENQN